MKLGAQMCQESKYSNEAKVEEAVEKQILCGFDERPTDRTSF